MNLAQASKKTTVVIAFMIAIVITITIVPTQLASSISRGCPPGQTCLLPSNPLNSNEGKKSIQSRGQDQTTGFSQGKKVRQDDNNNNTDDNGGQIRKAPIATSGNNIYIAWWTNKTGNDEVMFRASTDGGKTFGDKINLSNSTYSDIRIDKKRAKRRYGIQCISNLKFLIVQQYTIDLPKADLLLNSLLQILLKYQSLFIAWYSVFFGL